MKLLVFPHSHFCEKARWALDFKRIPFEPVAIMPGLHLRTVRKIAPKSTVPVLINGDDVVQGADEIIHHLDKNHSSHLLTPVDDEEREACEALEKSMDARLGENLRCILYHTLIDYPKFICHCFTYPMPRFKQLAFYLIYPVLRRKIYHTYVISDAFVDDAKRDFELAMEELELRLGQRNYLVSDQFTRADLSVASLLSLLVVPPEHPFPWGELPDPKATAFIDQYRGHPVSEWVRKMYRDHRLHAPTN